MVTVRGLTDDEQATLNRLVDQLKAKRRRNELRTAFMESKHLVRRLPPTVPEYVRSLGLVLGWPAKGLELLARRTKLDGFVIPGMDLETFGLDVILDENDYIHESRLSHVASLEHGPAFLLSTLGGRGEPEVVISRRSALDGTGDWNPRTRHLDSFLSVVEWKDGEPAEFNLYLPGVTLMVNAGELVDAAEDDLPRIPVEMLPFKARDGRPFGSSRITRPVMSLTRAAVRTLMRSEGTADYYSAPIIALLGANEGTFGSSPRLQMLLSAMFGIPDDEDALNPRVDLKQIQQASQEPHVKQLAFWAQLFAAEMNIPESALGVGVSQANPTSAEAYAASRENLIDEAEDTAAGWSTAHVRALQNAWMLAEGERSIPAELRRLEPIWRDPRHPSKASEADWFLKVSAGMPWVADTDTALDLIGVRPDVADRLRAERDVMRGRDLYRTLLDADEA